MDDKFFVNSGEKSVTTNKKNMESMLISFSFSFFLTLHFDSVYLMFVDPVKRSF